MRKYFLLLICAASVKGAFSQTDIQFDPWDLAQPVTNGIWLQPAQGTKAQPIWGFAEGISVGIAPLPGPRGLLRIYTPYLDHDPLVVTNFIAIEPIDKAKGIRGLSELEPSKLDGVRGKRFWSGNTPQRPSFPDRYYPAAGVIEGQGNKQTLTVYIFCEKFDNGADVYLRLRFNAGKPYEFELTTFTGEGCVPLNECILTATMGNKARLRTLYLAGGATKSAGALWPDYRDSNFTLHDHTPVAEMIEDGQGGVWFVAAPDETDPAAAVYASDTHEHWKYKGKVATQYWYCPRPQPGMRGVVNGRYCYWASKSPIPGGISFENFELMEQFQPGQSYIFGIIPQAPAQFIDGINPGL